MKMLKQSRRIPKTDGHTGCYGGRVCSNPCTPEQVADYFGDVVRQERTMPPGDSLTYIADTEDTYYILSSMKIKPGRLTAEKMIASANADLEHKESAWYHDRCRG